MCLSIDATSLSAKPEIEQAERAAGSGSVLLIAVDRGGWCRLLHWIDIDIYIHIHVYIRARFGVEARRRQDLREDRCPGGDGRDVDVFEVVGVDIAVAGSCPRVRTVTVVSVVSARFWSWCSGRRHISLAGARLELQEGCDICFGGGATGLLRVCSVGILVLVVLALTEEVC